MFARLKEQRHNKLQIWYSMYNTLRTNSSGQGTKEEEGDQRGGGEEEGIGLGWGL